MSDVVKVYQLREDKELRILNDHYPESPRQWDNVTKMLCFHKSYRIGDEHDYKSTDYKGWQGFKKQLEKDFDIAVIKPVYAYEHGNITVSTSPYDCRFDSGQVGWIFVTKQKIRECYGIKNVTKKHIQKAEINIDLDMETYDQYLTGDIYGFEVVEKKTCETCGHTKEEIIDSCWGFYGEDVIKNGILDSLDELSRRELKDILIEELI